MVQIDFDDREAGLSNPCLFSQASADLQGLLVSEAGLGKSDPLKQHRAQACKRVRALCLIAGLHIEPDRFVVHFTRLHQFPLVGRTLRDVDERHRGPTNVANLSTDGKRLLIKPQRLTRLVRAHR